MWNALQKIKPLRFLKCRDGVDEIHLAEEHGAAAVAVHTKIIHDGTGLLALRRAFLVVFPELRDWFSTAKNSGQG